MAGRVSAIAKSFGKATSGTVKGVATAALYDAVFGAKDAAAGAVSAMASSAFGAAGTGAVNLFGAANSNRRMDNMVGSLANGGPMFGGGAQRISAVPIRTSNPIEAVNMSTMQIMGGLNIVNQSVHRHAHQINRSINVQTQRISRLADQSSEVITQLKELNDFLNRKKYNDTEDRMEGRGRMVGAGMLGGGGHPSGLAVPGGTDDSGGLLSALGTGAAVGAATAAPGIVLRFFRRFLRPNQAELLFQAVYKKSPGLIGKLGAKLVAGGAAAIVPGIGWVITLTMVGLAANDILELTKIWNETFPNNKIELPSVSDLARGAGRAMFGSPGLATGDYGKGIGAATGEMIGKTPLPPARNTVPIPAPGSDTNPTTEGQKQFNKWLQKSSLTSNQLQAQGQDVAKRSSFKPNEAKMEAQTITFKATQKIIFEGPIEFKSNAVGGSANGRQTGRSKASSGQSGSTLPGFTMGGGGAGDMFSPQSIGSRSNVFGQSGAGGKGGAARGNPDAGQPSFGGNPYQTADAKKARSEAEKYLGRPMDDAEWDYLVRATGAEAGKDQTETAMVAASILNRARQKGKSVVDVLKEKNQFQAVTGTSKNGHAPSSNFVNGPGGARAESIYGAMGGILPHVSKDQVNFTSNDPRAYGPGTNPNYLKDGKVVGQSRFNTDAPLIPQATAGIGTFGGKVDPKTGINWSQPFKAGKVTDVPGSSRQGGIRRHAGYDTTSAEDGSNTPVWAMADGEVVAVSGIDGDAGGRRVKIRSVGPTGEIVEAQYMHLDNIDVRVGDKVRQGQPIGIEGTTGRSGQGNVGRHLHTTFRDGQGRVIPAPEVLGWAQKGTMWAESEAPPEVTAAAREKKSGVHGPSGVSRRGSFNHVPSFSEAKAKKTGLAQEEKEPLLGYGKKGSGARGRSKPVPKYTDKGSGARGRYRSTFKDDGSWRQSEEEFFGGETPAQRIEKAKQTPMVDPRFQGFGAGPTNPQLQKSLDQNVAARTKIIRQLSVPGLNQNDPNRAGAFAKGIAELKSELKAIGSKVDKAAAKAEKKEPAAKGPKPGFDKEVKQYFGHDSADAMGPKPGAAQAYNHR